MSEVEFDADESDADESDVDEIDTQGMHQTSEFC